MGSKSIIPNAEIYFHQLPEVDQLVIVDQFSTLAKMTKKDAVLRLMRMVNPKMKVKFFVDSGRIESFQFHDESKQVMIIAIRNYVNELI